MHIPGSVQLETAIGSVASLTLKFFTIDNANQMYGNLSRAFDVAIDMFHKENHIDFPCTM